MKGEPYRVLVELTGAKLWSLNWTRRIFHSSVGRLQQLKVSKGNKGRKMSQWETHCTLQELNQRQLKDNWSHVSPCWRQKIKMCKWQTCMNLRCWILPIQTGSSWCGFVVMGAHEKTTSFQ